MKQSFRNLWLLLLGLAIGLSVASLFPSKQFHQDASGMRPSVLRGDGQNAAGGTELLTQNARLAKNDGSAEMDADDAIGGNGLFAQSASLANNVSVERTGNHSALLSPLEHSAPPSPAPSTEIAQDMNTLMRIPDSSTAAVVLPEEILVPTGAKVPAVFLEDRALPAPQQKALERIADRFIESVLQAGPGKEQEVWEAARNSADQEFMKLYGFDELDLLQRGAALDALREGKGFKSNTDVMR
jgi:hypothetical protein